MYAEDAIAFPPDGDMVKGRPAIEALWKEAGATGIKSLEFHLVDVASSGNLAAETGTAVLHIQPAGQAATTASIKYVVVWKKGPGGWQIYRDIWNALPGAHAVVPTATPAPPH
jgi:ketosteroid isomerase-like protein